MVSVMLLSWSNFALVCLERKENEELRGHWKSRFFRQILDNHFDTVSKGSNPLTEICMFEEWYDPFSSYVPIHVALTSRKEPTYVI